MSHKPRISLTLDEKEYNELSDLSQKHQVSMAWICRKAISYFLEQFDKEQIQLPLPLPSQVRRK